MANSPPKEDRCNFANLFEHKIYLFLLLVCETWNFPQKQMSESHSQWRMVTLRDFSDGSSNCGKSWPASIPKLSLVTDMWRWLKLRGHLTEFYDIQHISSALFSFLEDMGTEVLPCYLIWDNDVTNWILKERNYAECSVQMQLSRLTVQFRYGSSIVVWDVFMCYWLSSLLRLKRHYCCTILSAFTCIYGSHVAQEEWIILAG